MTNESTTVNVSTSEALIIGTMSETRLAPTNSELEVMGGVAKNAIETTCLLEELALKQLLLKLF